MEILKHKSTQIILLPHQQLPFVELANRKHVEAFAARYGFNDGVTLQDQNGDTTGLLFNNGLYLIDTKEISFTRLIIEERKVTITFEGPTVCAERIWLEIRESLKDLVDTEDDNFLTPVLVSNESEIMSHLDFQGNKLYSKSLYAFLQKDLVEVSSSDNAVANLGTMTVSFAIDYIPENKMLNDRRINLVRKDFSLQTAVGYPADEQIYISKGPISSDIHIELLQKLEEKLK